MKLDVSIISSGIVVIYKEPEIAPICDPKRTLSLHEFKLKMRTNSGLQFHRGAVHLVESGILAWMVVKLDK
jgi:hypothetical protein